jgi:hypothetical protein
LDELSNHVEARLEAIKALESLRVALHDAVEYVGVIENGGVGHALLELAEVTVDGGELVVDGEHFGDDDAGSEVGVLGEIADVEVAATVEDAVINVVLDGEELEEGGLAGAVRADEADDFGVLDF